MRSYIEYFQQGGTSTQDKYFIQIKDVNGNPTGGKMLKSPEFILIENIKDLVKSFKNKVRNKSEYKEDLLKNSKSTPTINYNRIDSTANNVTTEV